MMRRAIKLAAGSLVGVVVILMTSGVTEARLAGNHNDTVLRDR